MEFPPDFLSNRVEETAALGCVVEIKKENIYSGELEVTEKSSFLLSLLEM